MRILLVEDHNRTSTYVSKGLTEALFQVDQAFDGEQALFLTREHDYDLIILDVMLPKLTGWQLISHIRQQDPSLPVLFLTACDSVPDRVKGLELGADDYLIKPFAFSELLARVRSLLKRKQPRQLDNYEIADLAIDITKHKVIRAEKQIPLTAKEFMLLLLFAEHQGEVLSRTYIAEKVWDINFDSDTNAIDVAIKRLRQKIDDGFDKKLIHTLRGVGYVFEER